MMLRTTIVLPLALLLTSIPLQTRAQANGPDQQPSAAAPGTSDGGPPAPAALDPSTGNATGTGVAAQPPAAQQSAPGQTAPGPQAQAQVQGSDTPAGQWVYTQQYGWLWMPYGDAYTQAPADDQGQPYMYVYGPALGWTWVAAPWVWGWGPYPYYGIYGPWRYAWYGWGPRWHGGYYGGYYGWRGGGWGWHGGGYRPVPYAGYGAVRPAPARPGFVAPPRVGGGVHVGRAVGGARGGHR